MDPLPAEVVAQLVSELDGWEVEKDGGAIRKGFVFPDFVAAFSFMTAVALKAEKVNHHPEWTNVFARVDVRLSTHDAGGVTEKDFNLARFMDAVSSR